MPLTDSDIERSAGAMRRAQELYERQVEAGRKELYRPGDGLPLYSQPEMVEREQALKENAAIPRDSLLERFVAEADEATAQADRELAIVDAAEPLSTLAADDLARAANLRPFLEENANLPGEQIERLIAGVLARGDKVEALVYARYLGRRAARESAAERERLNDLVQRLDPLTSDPTAAQRKADAEALMQRARKLRQAARETTRAEQVAEAQAQMVASGQYVRF